MKWITRERPRIDRLACPWLIRRFIDPDADFLYVPTCDVLSVARTARATPYDIGEAVMPIYDPLYTWCRSLRDERHGWFSEPTFGQAPHE